MDYQSLHFSTMVVDTHCDTLMRVLQAKPYRLAWHHEDGHVDIPRLRFGGVGLQFFASYIEPEFKPERALKRALQFCDGFYRELQDNPLDLHHILSYADVLKAQGEKKIGALLSIEGGEALEGDLGALRMLHRLGVRSIGLTWNERNQIAEGVGDCRSGGGLTDFGVSVVLEMNRLGMIVDVSHMSEPGYLDVLAVSKQPIIASHSNARALCNHVRNLTDPQILALQKNGGVMGINFASDFVRSGERATVSDVVNHIVHIASLTGSCDHVGLGSDYDGIPTTPTGLEDVSKLPALTKEMLRREFTEVEIRAVLGGNFLRVMAAVLG